ncbi:MAG: hypothetical protein ACJAYX_004692 [Planctomycetota bacterium]|jgi:hypothetical protein
MVRAPIPGTRACDVGGRFDDSTDTVSGSELFGTVPVFCTVPGTNPTHSR